VADQDIDFSHDKSMHHRFQFVGNPFDRGQNSTLAFGQSSAIRSAPLSRFEWTRLCRKKRTLPLPLQLAIDGIANKSSHHNHRRRFRTGSRFLRWRLDSRHVFEPRLTRDRESARESARGTERVRTSTSLNSSFEFFPYAERPESVVLRRSQPGRGPL